MHIYYVRILCRYVRLVQNASTQAVAIDLFTPLGALTYYNDPTQLTTSWDFYNVIGLVH